MSIEKKNDVIIDDNKETAFVVQRPNENLRTSFLNITNNAIKNDVFSKEKYEKITKDPIFNQIVFSLDDVIQRNNNEYEYIIEISKRFKKIMEIDSVLETVWFTKINKEYINKLYHSYLNKYKENGLQSITMQQKKWADYVDLNWDTSRVLLDMPMSDYTKSLILTIILHAIMIDECSDL